jgi:hypothetical protein
MLLRLLNWIPVVALSLLGALAAAFMATSVYEQYFGAWSVYTKTSDAVYECFRENVSANAIRAIQEDIEVELGRGAVLPDKTLKIVFAVAEERCPTIPLTYEGETLKNLVVLEQIVEMVQRDEVFREASLRGEAENARRKLAEQELLAARKALSNLLAKQSKIKSEQSKVNSVAGC